MRVIPTLLLGEGGLVKTVNFKKPKYVGDPINAVKIFNEKEVDEILIADIYASEEGRGPDIDFIKEVASECFMPLCYAGGISNLDQIRAIFKIGVEKVSLNSSVLENLELVSEASKIYGAQSIVVTMDVARNFFGKYSVYGRRGKKNLSLDPVEYAKQAEAAGAGELVINSIDRDGTGKGYDLELIEKISNAVNIPVVACGGAGELQHFREAVDAGASAVAAGSFFVFVGKHRAVLITYPDIKELDRLFGNN
ncbi:AglZ/HisF2 family acetamidino modification protein [Emcibacter nanhaiensis]|uniref:AglZ/HisF2 family acetamidino modification protein n=1 Tax=Emcibacter nanhaiensis TaxID=1505037 RepID=UPI001C613B44|nr:AglZ/HisF2 family acetamidino modification protein [Emcibacter nanhaiensis]